MPSRSVPSYRPSIEEIYTFGNLSSSGEHVMLPAVAAKADQEVVARLNMKQTGGTIFLML